VKKYKFLDQKIRAHVKKAVFFTPIPTTGSADGTQLKHSYPNDGLFISLDLMLEGEEQVSFTHMLMCTHTHTLVLQIETQRTFSYPS